MSLTHYSNEIIKIGIKFDLPNSIIGLIYNYNKGNYPNHFEILVGSADDSFYMNIKYCYLNDYYYNKEFCLYCDLDDKDDKDERNNICSISDKQLDPTIKHDCYNHYEIIVNSFDKLFYMNIRYCYLYEYYYNKEYCLYCDICIICDKRLGLPHHYCCSICVKTYNTKKFHCYYCNKCVNEEHRYCIECATCVPIGHDKYCSSNFINSKSDAVNQIKYYLTQTVETQTAQLKKPFALIAVRLGMQFIQEYPDIGFTNALYNKILEFMDNEHMNTNEILKLNKYKLIVEKIIG